MTAGEIELRDFEQYFPHAPTALCIKECARLSALRQFECPGPILDVGCGDGLFARIAFEGREIWGIDIDAYESRWAQASRAYAQIILGDITRAKLPEQFFETCIANCSLEHVPNIDGALATIHRSLKPGGAAYLFVPQRDWAESMWVLQALRKIGATGLSRTLQERLDHVFHHSHLYDEAGWREVLERTPFEIERLEPVLSSATTIAFEMFLIPSTLGWANKRMTTRWTNFPGLRRRSAKAAFKWTQLALALAGDPKKTAEFLIVLRRKA
jgi:SAM-dependent methyltransferase